MRIADRGMEGATPDAEGASLATPGNNPTRTEVSSPRLTLTLVLAQIVDHTLKRPIVGMFDQPMADGVVSNVQPFHVAGLIAPHLPVPKAPLPNRSILLSRPAPGDVGLPRANPTV
jgi:hypothetical protein